MSRTKRNPQERVKNRFSRGEIARRVRREREAAGLSVRGLAAKAGVSRTVISKLENVSGDALVSTLASIAKVFGITLDSLVWGK